LITVDKTREEYIKEIFEIYKLSKVLADKNDCKALRLIHKRLDKDIVLHSFPKNIAIYDMLSKIRCDNLPLIYDVINLIDGQIVLEEYVDGITVAQVMESGRYSYLGARRIIKSLCNALMILHKNNFVHRDIKPENIMIDKQGRVVLIDFNASRKVSLSSKDTEVLGTVGYASPEQMGITQSDPRTDIYAIGILLNVMVTGKHPSEFMAKGKVGRIVKKCTCINPDERFLNVEKLNRYI